MCLQRRGNAILHGGNCFGHFFDSRHGIYPPVYIMRVDGCVAHFYLHNLRTWLMLTVVTSSPIICFLMRVDISSWLTWVRTGYTTTGMHEYCVCIATRVRWKTSNLFVHCVGLSTKMRGYDSSTLKKLKSSYKSSKSGSSSKKKKHRKVNDTVFKSHHCKQRRTRSRIWM